MPHRGMSQGIWGLEFQPKVYEMDVVVDFVESAEGPVFRFFQNGVHDPVFAVDTYLSILILRLRVQGLADPSEVEFASHLQWLDEKKRVPMAPPPTDVRRESSVKLAILDLNTVEAGDMPQRFSFLVSVLYQGQMYTSQDPTIINKEPPGGQALRGLR